VRNWRINDAQSVHNSEAGDGAWTARAPLPGLGSPYAPHNCQQCEKPWRTDQRPTVKRVKPTLGGGPLCAELSTFLLRRRPSLRRVINSSPLGGGPLCAEFSLFLPKEEALFAQRFPSFLLRKRPSLRRGFSLSLGIPPYMPPYVPYTGVHLPICLPMYRIQEGTPPYMLLWGCIYSGVHAHICLPEGVYTVVYSLPGLPKEVKQWFIASQDLPKREKQ